MQTRHDNDSIRDRWIKALGPANPHGLDRRLAWDNLNHASAYDAFAEDHRRFCWNDIAKDAPPDWVLTLASLQAAIKASASGCTASPPDHPSHLGEPLPFRELWQPAVDASLDRLRLRVGAAIGSQRTAPWEQHLAAALLARLCQTSERALWELFQTDRGAGLSLLAQLESGRQYAPPPPRQVYWRFIQQHRENGLATVLRGFPVLGRLLADLVDFWLDSSAEMLVRLHQDRPVLATTFGIPRTASLEAVHGLGDHHRQGRTVALLVFSDGDLRWNIVYKPRDIRIDFEFQRLLRDEETLAGLPPLASLSVWQGEGYGYMEFVQHVPCRDEQELTLFYTNAGRLSALLHLFACTDCHRENLIANGPNLFFIDGETLLTPLLKSEVQPHWEPGAAEGAPVLEAEFKASIAQTELLPSWVLVGSRGAALDFSTFGAEPMLQAAHAIPGWLNINTDLMARGSVQATAPPSTHLPIAGGQANPFPRYLSHFKAGFRAQSAAMMHRRLALLAPGGVLDRFAGLTRRIVIRATRIYGAIQAQQLEPDSLRSILEHRLRLEQLARLYLTTPQRPGNWLAFAEERRQMAQLDIPYFTHRTDSTRISLADDGAAIDDVFANSGLDECRRRIMRLDHEAIEFQLEIVEGMAAAKRLGVHAPLILGGERQPRRWPAKPRAHRLGTVSRRSLTRDLVGDILSIARGNGAEWLGFDLAADCQRFHFGPLGLSLYSGASGIAVFLASLAASESTAGSYDARRLRALAHSILQPLWKFGDGASCDSLQRWWRDQPLGLAGAAGQLLTLQALDTAYATEADLPSGSALARKIVEVLDEDLIAAAPLAVMDGIAGLVGPLLRSDSEKALQVAMAIGDRLADFLLLDPTAAPERTISAGFASGSAGVMAALAQLHRGTGSQRYLDAARQILARTRETLGAATQGWTSQEGFDNSWCDGLSGLALSRLCLIGTSLWDAEAVREVDFMLSARPAGEQGESLCCGRFGTIAILRMASELLDKPVWEAQAERIETSIAAAGHNSERLRVSPHARHQLGFMNGLSGIGLIMMNEPHSRATAMALLSSGLLPAHARPLLGSRIFSRPPDLSEPVIPVEIPTPSMRSKRTSERIGISTATAAPGKPES